MAHYYGTIQGNKGKVSRVGTKASGLIAYAASWEGAVRVEVYRKDERDHAYVALVPWHGNGTSRVLYDGPVSGQCAAELNSVA